MAEIFNAWQEKEKDKAEDLSQEKLMTFARTSKGRSNEKRPDLSSSKKAVYTLDARQSLGDSNSRKTMDCCKDYLDNEIDNEHIMQHQQPKISNRFMSEKVEDEFNNVF